MRARRFLLLAGIAAAALLPHPYAQAASPADMGGWGQAWGGDDTPEPAPQPRKRAQVQPAQPAVQAGPETPMPKGPNAADIGGWGGAWGSDAAPAPQPARQPAPAVRPVPVAAESGPRPADVGGWGNAWGDDAPAQPAPRRQVDRPSPLPALAQPEATQGPVRVQTPALPTPRTLGLPGTAADKNAEGGEAPVQMTADTIIHDRELGIVTAKGRVEVIQAGRTMVSDQVSYNLKQDIITANGNVMLMEPSGEVAFTDYFELTGDFKEGVAQQIRVILADNSRLAGASARRVGGDRTDFDKAVYTACEPCASNPNARPLWEAKAERVTHNQADQTVEYRDVWMELAGVPIFYSPYLSHPDPSVKRKSGFLTPSAGMSSNLGANATIPYFWAIKDNQDVTFAPRFLFPRSTTKKTRDVEGDDVLRHMVLAGDHRWLGREGETRTAASLTADKYTGDLRGHLDAKGRFDLNNTWRAGYLVQRTTDDTYNAVYGYPFDNNHPWLTTRPYLEGFGRRSYAMAEGFAFQGLRETDREGQTPYVLPHLLYSYVGAPGDKGGYWTVDTDMLAYARTEGTDAARLSTQAAYVRPFASRMGDITTVTTSLRADGYDARDLDQGGSSNQGRVVPQIAANWRFPFMRPSETMTQVVEPVAMAAASPNGGNPRKIPNEDSIDFELDEANVLRPNRMAGLDRVEGGVRGAYGLRWTAYPQRGGYVSALAAQGWRAHPDSVFGQESGFQDNLSDYVARIDVSPRSYLSFLNRTRLDKETLEVRRHENSLSVGSPMLNTSITHLMFDRHTGESGETFARRQSVIASVRARLARYWSAYASSEWDLTDDGGPVEWAARLSYSDECFAFVTNLRRHFTHDRDLEAGYDLTFNIVFKTLGDVPFNVF